jgi:hypothetical protein
MVAPWGTSLLHRGHAANNNIKKKGQKEEAMRISASNIKKFMIFLSLITLLTNVSTTAIQKTHHFKPTKYYYTYDAKHEPVLKLKTGDILVTTTVDAFGNKISRSDQLASEIIHAILLCFIY